MKIINVRIKDASFDATVRDGSSHVYIIGRATFETNDLILHGMDALGFLKLISVPFLFGVIVGALAVGIF